MVCHQAKKHENVLLLVHYFLRLVQYIPTGNDVGQIAHSELTHKTCWNAHTHACMQE